MKELDVNNELRESLGVSEKKDENRENKENIENKEIEERENNKTKEIEIKKEETKEIKEEKIVTKEEIEEKTIEEKTIEEERGVIANEEVEEKINSLFNQFSKDSEVYVTYNVFILRDGDTIDSILEKYNITE